MDYAFEQKVRERAYEIWQSAGMSDGLAEAHWFTAEISVKSEMPATKKRANGMKPAVVAVTKKQTARTSADKSAPRSSRKPMLGPTVEAPVKSRSKAVAKTVMN